MQKTQKYKYIFLIMVTFIVACIETDIYLPAFPDMMEYFHTSEATIQSLLSWNFIGICLSGPFYGPLSDSFGRKKILMFALTLFLIGSIGTIVTQSIEGMLIWRVFQGIGSGGCFTLGTAIIFDVFHDDEATKVINEMNSIVPIIMALAPMAGGYLNIHYGFRSNFIVIALFVVMSFVICLFFLEETHPKEKRAPFNIKTILKDFGIAMRDYNFWRPTLLVSFIFAGYLTYVSYSAILFVNNLAVSKSIFPYYQASVLLAFVSASLSANRMIIKLGLDKTKTCGLILVLFGITIFLVSAYVYPSRYNLFHAGMMLFSFGAGWLMGPYFVEAMEALPEIRGVTASLVTSFRLLFTASIIGLASANFDGTIYPLVLVTLGLLVGGSIIYFKK